MSGYLVEFKFGPGQEVRTRHGKCLIEKCVVFKDAEGLNRRCYDVIYRYDSPDWKNRLLSRHVPEDEITFL